MRLFGRIISRRRFLFAGVELTAITAILLLAAWVLFDVTLPVYLLYEGGLVRVLAAALSFVLGLYVVRLYTDVRVRFPVGLAFQLVQALGLVFLLQALFGYVLPDLELPLRVMIVAGPLIVLGLFFWRLLVNAVMLEYLPVERVLLVGSGELVREIGRAMETDASLGMRLAGYVDDAHPPGTLLGEGKVLGPAAALGEICRQVKPARIVAEPLSLNAAQRTLLELKTRGIPVESAVTAYEGIFGRVSLLHLASSRAALHENLAPQRANLALQSVYSNLVALFGSLLVVPLIVCFGAAIRITSRGPALESRLHQGWRGIPFRLYRFRSTDAKGRLTRMGRFLCRYRLVGLPQWLNLLRGEIALFGPRAVRVEFAPILAEIVPLFGQRYLVKPGLMGWSQVKCDFGRDAVDSILRLEHDLYYLKHISPALDAYIILQSLRYLLMGETGSAEAA